ncbi:MAG TPA: hypothetical protein RMH85_00230 [Polyangiaceae bacterium LLY-WYZ-15_(1-7)]|nr:hypothetical protein [Myxococcales bacterium]MAT27509.1 hypothetical protein [Sandaracinus sp.]HJK95221.1 hypothetical protein [Polyangiaceae bacterium LLY-WYZ-15_(1-7)]MBJ71575.1 hypothetical protein [Sandaracinus sp.]HJL03952.1 hypothetical protein [Polyangiaceae bacterium LLY-WYZ-15_(1-7)]
MSTEPNAPTRPRWSPGAEVRLRDGGPVMTVELHQQLPFELVRCTWRSVDGVLRTVSLAPSDLERR